MNAGHMLLAGGLDAARVRALVYPVEPDSIRLLPAPRLMRLIWPRGIRAMTLGSTIYLDPILLTGAQDRAGLLLVHELVHARQWRETGGRRFLWRYLSSYLRGRWEGLGHHGAYLAIPYEVEARDLATRAG